MPEKELLKTFRRKLRRLIKLETPHCGHPELMEKAIAAELDLIEFFSQSIRGIR